MSDDPYTNVIPGFIPADQLTREWAEAHLGTRLDDFARALASDAPIAAQPVAEGRAA